MHSFLRNHKMKELLNFSIPMSSLEHQKGQVSSLEEFRKEGGLFLFCVSRLSCVIVLFN